MVNWGAILDLSKGGGGWGGNRVAGHIAAHGDLTQFEAAVNLNGEDGTSDDVPHAELARVGDLCIETNVGRNKQRPIKDQQQDKMCVGKSRRRVWQQGYMPMNANEERERITRAKGEHKQRNETKIG